MCALVGRGAARHADRSLARARAKGARRKGRASVPVEIDSCDVCFESDCEPARARLPDILKEIFSSPYHRFAIGTEPALHQAPTLRYEDRPRYSARYHPADDLCVIAGPWAEIGNTTLLGMWLFYLSELVRQRRGQYLLHASAVVRRGRAIVFAGEGESGKTSAALHLCLTEQCALFSNNKVKVGLLDGQPSVLYGDPIFNFRFSSLERYSPALCRKVFATDAVDATPWLQKRRVRPEELGIAAAHAPCAIGAFVLLTHDERAVTTTVRPIAEGDTSHDGFWVQANLYMEMSALIRGIRFIPSVGAAGYRDFFVPCLDCEEFVSRRVAFLQALFRDGRVVRIRGPLEASVQAALQL
jgi:hypothetical protein